MEGKTSRRRRFARAVADVRDADVPGEDGENVTFHPAKTLGMARFASSSETFFFFFS